jgi:hypothetical protein
MGVPGSFLVFIASKLWGREKIRAGVRTLELALALYVSTIRRSTGKACVDLAVPEFVQDKKAMIGPALLIVKRPCAKRTSQCIATLL